MWEKNLYSRHNLIGMILLLYTLPVIFLTAFSSGPSFFFSVFALFFGLAGSFVFFVLIRGWEKAADEQANKKIERLQPIETSKPASDQTEEMRDPSNEEEPQGIKHSIEEFQAKHANLLKELNKKSEELRKLEQEKEKIQQRADDIFQEFAAYKDTSQGELDQKQVMLSEYQQTITEQRAVIKKKQEQVAELETKVGDLNYEIKTLIHLTDFSEAKTQEVQVPIQPIEKVEEKKQKPEEQKDEEESTINLDRQVQTKEDASGLLKRCVDIAQKITANHFMNASSRFRDLHINSYSLDLRRLFDSLKSESSGVVLFYSPKENKLLFINNQAKSLFGWSPQKIVQDFYEIVQDGLGAWNKTISNLSNHYQETTIELNVKTKAGQIIPVYCQMRSIPTGIFKNNIIGVLYPVEAAVK